LFGVSKLNELQKNSYLSEEMDEMINAYPIQNINIGFGDIHLNRKYSDNTKSSDKPLPFEKYLEDYHIDATRYTYYIYINGYSSTNNGTEYNKGTYLSCFKSMAQRIHDQNTMNSFNFNEPVSYHNMSQLYELFKVIRISRHAKKKEKNDYLPILEENGNFYKIDDKYYFDKTNYQNINNYIAAKIKVIENSRKVTNDIGETQTDITSLKILHTMNIEVRANPDTPRSSNSVVQSPRKKQEIQGKQRKHRGGGDPIPLTQNNVEKFIGNMLEIFNKFKPKDVDMDGIIKNAMSQMAQIPLRVTYKIKIHMEFASNTYTSTSEFMNNDETIPINSLNGYTISTELTNKKLSVLLSNILNNNDLTFNPTDQTNNQETITPKDHYNSLIKSLSDMATEKKTPIVFYLEFTLETPNPNIKLITVTKLYYTDNSTRTDG